ncbi:ribokinase [Bryocella elongata]|uniref:Ribokinase n=1 Tax=Bryocella elongata TaxID=863522 RepID=A0A1H5U4T1_9BACT|nr:ribokinase [Bryocella elongata]SEF70115.1 ribokinase [Bryocella elongata]
MNHNRITVLGSFVADLAFRVDRLPARGETILGPSFVLGPGGKGSNQAVAAARSGGHVSFITKLGRDPFGDIARKLYADEGIDTGHVYEATVPTGAAAILIDAASGDNAIIVVPGACFTITTDEVDAARELIAGSSVLMAQLELPLEIVEHGLALARSLGVATILNPAPAAALPEHLYQLADYITPNESEAEALTGVAVVTLADAERAADVFLARGVKNAIITLGAQGAFVKNATMSAHVVALDAGAVVETTGAGDAFNGGLAVALTEGLPLEAAVRFGCATAAISVTRPGTAPSMPHRAEIDCLLASHAGTTTQPATA